MVSYGKAAQRHMHDAVLLVENNRMNNAAQLLGYSAECCVKRLLEHHRYPSTEDGLVKVDPDTRLAARKHVNELAVMENELRLFLSGRTGQWCLPFLGYLSSFRDWRIDTRYDEEFQPSMHARVDAWKTAAINMLEELQRIELEGGGKA